eukprot:TRINITY_DN346_c0_g1_i1.p1 TRINITY_DN346_c0_g1~~TRINITY_DN346_c0_g1_i1.p1  ORF type:complete len:702 (-),score=211.55 TRINITY_DN346_c0_g1_i1:100-2205(-)
MNTNTQSGTSVHVAPSTVQTPNPLMQTAQQLSHGQLPPNAQLQQTINSTQMALEESKYETPLSAKGQLLVDDAKDLLQSASRMIQEKNSDEKFQRLLGNAGSAATATRENFAGTGVRTNVGREDLRGMRGNVRSILTSGRSMGSFAVRSAQFRELMVELLDIFQTILRSAQQQVASQPSGSMPLSGINSTPIPQDQRDAIWQRFTALLNQLASRPEYYTAVDHAFQVVDRMGQKGKQIKTQTGGTEALPTDQYDSVWQDAKLVIEEFSGAGTMDTLETRNWALYNAMKDDPEARMWFREFRTYVLDVLKNPQMLNQPNQKQHGQQILDQGRYLFQGKYRSNFTDVFDQLRLVLTNIKNDSATQDFTTKMQKFGADLAFDASGKPDLFVIQESLGQMRAILVPLLSKSFTNVPIPKIEGSNLKYDFSVEGLLLNVGDLLPEFINFRTKSDTQMSVNRLHSQKNSVKVVAEIDRIRANFKDIRFFYRRKRVPHIEDHGVCDVDLSQGTGMSLRLVWKLKSTPNQPFVLRLLKVKCNIDRLTITVRNARHSILDKLVTKLFAGTIKKQIANAIVNNIIKTLTPMSTKLNELFKRRPMVGLAERANDQLKNTVFSGEPGVMAKAKEAITSGAQQVKGMVQNQGTTGTTTTTTAVPVMVTESYIDQPITFVERDRVGRTEWAYEWYEPSPTDQVLDAAQVNSAPLI